MLRRLTVASGEITHHAPEAGATGVGLFDATSPHATGAWWGDVVSGSWLSECEALVDVRSRRTASAPCGGLVHPAETPTSHLVAGARRGGSSDMAPRASRIALAGLLGMLAVGCGGESDPTTSTTDAVTTSTSDSATTAAPPNVDQYLLQVDEGPGLESMSSPQTESGEPFPPARRRCRDTRAQWLHLDDLSDRPRRQQRRREQRPTVRDRGRSTRLDDL